MLVLHIDNEMKQRGSGETSTSEQAQTESSADWWSSLNIEDSHLFAEAE